MLCVARYLWERLEELAAVHLSIEGLGKGVLGAWEASSWMTRKMLSPRRPDFVEGMEAETETETTETFYFQESLWEHAHLQCSAFETKSALQYEETR